MQIALVDSEKRLWLSLLTHALHFTVFFSLCPLAERGRQGVCDPSSASYEGCLVRLRLRVQGKRHPISEVACPLGGRGCVDVGSGMPAHPCAGAMGWGAQPHHRQQKPLSVALHIHKANPAPSPLALAQSVPHMPPLSRFLVDVCSRRGWSGLRGCSWPGQGGRATPPKSTVLWSR